MGEIKVYVKERDGYSGLTSLAAPSVADRNELPTSKVAKMTDMGMMTVQIGSTVMYDNGDMDSLKTDDTWSEF